MKMEQTYERHLSEIVSSMPTEPCIVALVPTIPLEEAAALASDVAQRVAKSRTGHTILTSFESHPSCIDHEVGVEGGIGLTEVLSKDVTVAGAAAPGKARGYIYLPAGSQALAGDVLLRSQAWRMLSAAVLRSGGTVLAVVPPTVFEAVNEGRSEGAGRRFDALVWLGPSGRSPQGVHLAAIASGARDLGGLGLPTGPETGPTDLASLEPVPLEPSERRTSPDRRLTDDRRAPVRPSTTPAAPHIPQPNGAGRVQPASIVGLATQMGSGPRRRAWVRRRRRNQTMLVVLCVVALAMVSALLIRNVLSESESDPRGTPPVPPAGAINP